MIDYAKKSLILLSGLLFFLPLAFAQNQFSHVRLGGWPVQAVPAFRAPVQNSLRSSTAAHPRPIIVRMPAPPAQHRGTASTFSRQTSASDSMATVVPDSVLTSGPFIDLSNLGPFLNTSTPGLGFDFAHLAALNHDLGVRAIIDPVTQHELALTEQLLNSQRGAATSAFTPFLGSVDYSEPVAYNQQQQPQIIVLQQPALSRSAEETAPSAASSSAASEEPPLPPVGEFVLVLRGGKQIKAVAFTRQDDSIVYVTSEGARSSFPAAELDASATEQINQQHGTPLKIPF